MRKSEKTKSKKIERLRKGAEKHEIPKSFQFRINLNKKTQHKAAENIKIQTQNLI